MKRLSSGRGREEPLHKLAVEGVRACVVSDLQYLRPVLVEEGEETKGLGRLESVEVPQWHVVSGVTVPRHAYSKRDVLMEVVVVGVGETANDVEVQDQVGVRLNGGIESRLACKKA